MLHEKLPGLPWQAGASLVIEIFDAGAWCFMPVIDAAQLDGCMPVADISGHDVACAG